jgi:hypothetical protein
MLRRFIRLDLALLALSTAALGACTNDELEPLPLVPQAETAPDIFIEPTAQQFTSIIINQAETATFTVGNGGDAPLVVDRVLITGAQADGFNLAVNTVSASTLLPRELSDGLSVSFLPAAPQPYDAVLEVWSNDPDENPVRIALNGAGKSRGPVALCSVTPATLTLPGAATFGGGASYDPDGLELVSFAWALSGAPAGSAATLPGCGNSVYCGPFEPDLAGTYTAALTVTNAAGVSAGCRAELVVLEAEHPPTAVCSVNPPTIDLLHPVPATWIGDASSDPDGDALVEYAWVIQARPAGSTAALPGCNNAANCGPFVPDLPGAYAARLTVADAAGLRDSCVATLTVTQTGQGPVAICAVNPPVVHPPFESATWDGRGSYDPDGYALVRHTWLLTGKPDGSAAGMPSCGNNALCGPFAPDIAGAYTGQLTVENEIGMTASCTVELEAVPRQDLWIEMYWAHNGDDMDLHLLKPGGTLRTAGDCYFMNCVGGGPDWGLTGTGADDPALDLDDISGTGPENINISAPAAGLYTVTVHDYPGSVYTPANAVTVNVYVDGALVHTDTRSIAGEDVYQPFCTVSWPAGVVTPL